MKLKLKWVLLSLVTVCSQISYSAESIDKFINSHQEEYQQLALKIWELAEVGYQEHKSSALLQESLSSKGFKVETLPYMPTGFIAEYGKGKSSDRHFRRI
ncbi:MAG: hypothetical protein Ct9H300mP20_17660 [Gammaproteobacteria bacterium]|nr:MAG: hypothetical protein Ct9H300mP20_17660 [Gammaproteobacteria bacterium]